MTSHVNEAVRFGLGDPDGLHSGSWAVRAGSDGSIYVTARGLEHGTRGTAKVSLHPKRPDGTGGRWKIEHTPEFMETRPDLFVDGAMDPLISEWDAEAQRLGPDVPIREGFGVVLGRFSLGPRVIPDDPLVDEEQRRYLGKVAWFSTIPPTGHAWQWTLLVGDSGKRISAPGTTSMDAEVAGEFDAGGFGSVYLMRHLIPTTQEMIAKITIGLQRAGESLLSEPSGPAVLRGHIFGKEDNGLRWALDIAATHGFPAEELRLD